MNKKEVVKTWDKIYTPEQYLYHILFSANMQGINDNFIYQFTLMSIGANLVSSKTESGRKFFEETLRLVL